MMAYEISWFDLTSGVRTTFPMLPKDSEFTLEHAQNFNESPILGTYPNIQVVAAQSKQLQMQLELYGEAGDDFYEEYVIKAYGLFDGSYMPHVIQLAWGPTSDQAFTGRAIGQQPTRVTLGRSTGEVFSRTFDFNLRQVNNNAPRVVSVQTGQVVQPPTVTHTVVQGDDLLSIAKKYGSSVEKVASLNPGVVYAPVPGSRLLIPR